MISPSRPPRHKLSRPSGTGSRAWAGKLKHRNFTRTRSSRPRRRLGPPQLERSGADQRALQTQRRAQELVALEIHCRTGTANAHGDGSTTGALVERHRDEAADVDAVVLEDLLADLIAAEPLRPQSMRHTTTLVVRCGLGRILHDLQIWPALRALPGVCDLLRLEDTADVLADAAARR